MQPEPEFLVISENSLTFWPEENQSTIKVESSGEFDIEVRDPWCQVLQDNIHPGELNVFVHENDEIGVERNTTILLRLGDLERVIDVNQLAYEPFLNIDKKEIFLNDAQGLTFSLEINANVNYQIELPDWIHQKSDRFMIDSHVHHFEILPLDDFSELRRGVISIVSDEFKLNRKEVVVDQRNSRSQIKIGTYNIYVGNWINSRKELVYEILRKNDFDIFGTQEGTIIHLNDIGRKFDEYQYIGVGRDGGDEGEFSAIFYKKELFELLEQGNFWFSKTPDEPSYGWDAVNYRRICTWGKFRDKRTNKTFYLFNSHYDHQGEIARRESSKLLLEMMKNVQQNNASPMFSVGDFNANVHTDPMRILLDDGLLLDSREKSLDQPFGPYGTFQGFDVNLISNNRIDYILVTDNVMVETYGVIDDRIDGRCPSDHDPVVIEVEF